MTVLNYLQAVKKVIATPRLWLKGEEENMGRHCLIGAIHEVKAGDETVSIISQVIYKLFPERGMAVDDPRDVIVYFNDDRDTRHKDVMRVLDMAIEEVETKAMWAELKQETKPVPRPPKVEKQEKVNAIR